HRRQPRPRRLVPSPGAGCRVALLRPPRADQHGWAQHGARRALHERRAAGVVAGAGTADTPYRHPADALAPDAMTFTVLPLRQMRVRAVSSPRPPARPRSSRMPPSGLAVDTTS